MGIGTALALGAASGAGQGLAQAGTQFQNYLNQQDLARQSANLDIQKSAAIMNMQLGIALAKAKVIDPAAFGNSNATTYNPTTGPVPGTNGNGAGIPVTPLPQTTSAPATTDNNPPSGAAPSPALSLGSVPAAIPLQTNAPAVPPAAGLVPTQGATPGYFDPNGQYGIGRRAFAFGNPGGATLMASAIANDPNIAAKMPTDLMKYVGVLNDPNAPLAAKEMAAGAIQKANYIPLTSVRGPAYATPDGQMHINPGTTIEVTNSDGSKQTIPLSSYLAKTGTNGSPQAPTVADGRYPVAPGNAPAGNVTFGVSPSSANKAALEQSGAASGREYGDDLSTAGGYASRVFALNKALTGLQGANTGPGSDAINQIKSFLVARGTPGVDVDKIQSFDEANKYLIQTAIAQAGTLGQGTNEKLAASLSGNASTSISNLAAQDVVKANIALEKMNNAATQSAISHNIPPGQYQAWKAQFMQHITPSVFAWDMLDQNHRNVIAQSMSPAQRSDFTSQYNWALVNHFIDGPQQPATTGGVK